MKTFLAILALVAVLGIGLIAFRLLSPSSQTITIPEQSNTQTTAPTSSAKTYTMSEVQTHNSSTGCWSVINNNVYDLTSWIDSHPGGADKSSVFAAKMALQPLILNTQVNLSQIMN